MGVDGGVAAVCSCSPFDLRRLPYHVLVHLVTPFTVFVPVFGSCGHICFDFFRDGESTLFENLFRHILSDPSLHVIPLPTLAVVFFAVPLSPHPGNYTPPNDNIDNFAFALPPAPGMRYGLQTESHLLVVCACGHLSPSSIFTTCKSHA